MCTAITHAFDFEKTTEKPISEHILSATDSGEYNCLFDAHSVSGACAICPLRLPSFHSRTDGRVELLRRSDTTWFPFLPHTPKMQLDTSKATEATQGGAAITLPLLQLVSEARAEHGMRQHDHESYR